MTTLAEIEAAAETLQATELQELLLPYKATTEVTRFLERLRLALRERYWLPGREVT